MDAPVGQSELEPYLEGALKAAIIKQGHIFLGTVAEGCFRETGIFVGILAAPESFRRLVHLLVKYPHDVLRDALPAQGGPTDEPGRHGATPSSTLGGMTYRRLSC